MANADRECYSVDAGGYAYGPYTNESDAEAIKDPGEEIMWLERHEINEYGYVPNYR
jgi:hypothetical protein